MSSEQSWSLPPVTRTQVERAVRKHAARVGLPWQCEQTRDEIAVTVQFPVARLARLALDLSQVYDTVEQADAELHPRDPAPEHYTCTFEVFDARDEDGEFVARVYTDDEDNHAAWAAIVSFVDAVVDSLGGRWED